MPVMAGIALAVIIASLLMGAFGNARMNQQGMRNMYEINSSAVPLNYGRTPAPPRR